MLAPPEACFAEEECRFVGVRSGVCDVFVVVAATAASVAVLLALGLLKDRCVLCDMFFSSNT